MAWLCSDWPHHHENERLTRLSLELCPSPDLFNAVTETQQLYLQDPFHKVEAGRIPRNENKCPRDVLAEGLTRHFLQSMLLAQP